MVTGAVVSWLVRSSPDRAVRVRALVGDILLCSWAGETLNYNSASLPRAPAKLLKPKILRGRDLRWTSIPSRE